MRIIPIFIAVILLLFALTAFASFIAVHQESPPQICNPNQFTMIDGTTSLIALMSPSRNVQILYCPTDADIDGRQYVLYPGNLYLNKNAVKADECAEVANPLKMPI